MPVCMNCYIQLLSRTQLHEYFAVNLSPEFVSIIEEWCGREVSADDRICQECVSLVESEITNRLENPDHQSRKQVGHLYVCICCGISLSKRSNRRRHKLQDASKEKSYIEKVISPRQVPDEAWACHPCWMRGRNNHAPRPPNIRPEQVFISSPVESRGKHEQEHAEQEASGSNIAPTPIEFEEIPAPPPVEAWVADNHGYAESGASDPNIAPTPIEFEEILFPQLCESWMEDNPGQREQEASDPNVAPTPTEPVEIFIPSPVEPRVEGDQEKPEQESTPPSNLASPASEADSWSELNLPPVQRRVQSDREDTLRLPNYRRTADSTSRCFVPNCENSERRRIPMPLRRAILKKHKLYLTQNARVCQNHFAVDNWADIFNEFVPTFNASQIESMLNLFSNDTT